MPQSGIGPTGAAATEKCLIRLRSKITRTDGNPEMAVYIKPARSYTRRVGRLIGNGCN